MAICSMRCKSGSLLNVSPNVRSEMPLNDPFCSPVMAVWVACVPMLLESAPLPPRVDPLEVAASVCELREGAENAAAAAAVAATTPSLFLRVKPSSCRNRARMSDTLATSPSLEGKPMPLLLPLFIAGTDTGTGTAAGAAEVPAIVP